MGKTSLAFAALAAAVISAPASATAVLTDTWYTFAYGAVGSGFTNGSGATLGVAPDSIAAPDPSWTFTLLTAGSITIVDGFLVGDQFTLTDNGSVIGTTSAPGTGSGCGNVITACLIDPNMSQATFALAAGAHSINGTVAASPFTGGAGFFRINSVAAVPEPGTWAMMLLGLGAVGFAFRRRVTSVA